MTTSNTTSQTKSPLAALAYVPVLGLVYGFLIQKDDELALFHAKQALALTIGAVLAPILWGIVGWLLMLIPMVGPLLAAFLFAPVILVYMFLFAMWILGIVYALQGKDQPLPLIGNWV